MLPSPALWCLVPAGLAWDLWVPFGPELSHREARTSRLDWVGVVSSSSGPCDGSTPSPLEPHAGPGLGAPPVRAGSGDCAVTDSARSPGPLSEPLSEPFASLPWRPLSGLGGVNPQPLRSCLANGRLMCKQQGVLSACEAGQQVGGKQLNLLFVVQERREGWAQEQARALC